MMFTKDQALNALYFLRECHEKALLVYWLDGHSETAANYHALELQTKFAQAATALGYMLTKVEDVVPPPVSEEKQEAA